jgi:hypothetical protein
MVAFQHWTSSIFRLSPSISLSISPMFAPEQTLLLYRHVLEVAVYTRS